MKFKRKQRAPLAHSNLTTHENLRSHYDPNGSWTGVPDGWDKDGEYPSKNDRTVYGSYSPTENGYVQQKGDEPSYKIAASVESSREFFPLEGEVAPTNGDSYAQNTRDMSSAKYRDRMNNDMAQAEAANDDSAGRPRPTDGDAWKRQRPVDPSPYCADFSPRGDIESGEDIYPLGDVGTPAKEDGYPSIPDGELPIDKAAIKEDITPVQDADDL